MMSLSVVQSKEGAGEQAAGAAGDVPGRRGTGHRQGGAAGGGGLPAGRPPIRPPQRQDAQRRPADWPARHWEDLAG